jgi:tetratricopeptide (TPR) repeat protein
MNGGYAMRRTILIISVAVICATLFSVLCLKASGPSSQTDGFLALQEGRDGQAFWPGTQSLEVDDAAVPSPAQQRILDIRSAYDNGRLAELIGVYEKEVISRPDSAISHFSLGYACSVATNEGVVSKAAPERNNYACAQKELQRAIKLDPSLREAQIAWAYFLFRTGFAVKAIEQFKAFLATAPDDAEAMFWIAECFSTHGEVYDAERSAEELQKLHDQLFCESDEMCIEWLQKACKASPNWLLPKTRLMSKYMSIAREQGKSDNVKYQEPWRGLAMEQCREIIKVADPEKDGELLARVTTRLAELTEN